MVKKGVDDATLMVEANGGTVNFMQTQNYDNFGPDLAALIEQAVAQGAASRSRTGCRNRKPPR